MKEYVLYAQSSFKDLYEQEARMAWYPAGSEALCSGHLCCNKGMLNKTDDTFTWDLTFAYLMKVIIAFFYYIIPGATWQVMIMLA